MDESSALIESILPEQDEDEADKYLKKMTTSEPKQNGDALAWQTVSYQKRNRRPSKSDSLSDHPNGNFPASDVFRSIELHSDERRRRIREAQAEAVTGDSAAVRSKRHSDDDDGNSDAELNGAVENGEPKKVKVKKPKLTVAEAASKMDAANLAAFLADITEMYESQQYILLLRLADYFGRAFASVRAAQFPWLKMFKESTVSKMVHIPLSYISENVYKTSIS